MILYFIVGSMCLTGCHFHPRVPHRRHSNWKQNRSWLWWTLCCPTSPLYLESAHILVIKKSISFIFYYLANGTGQSVELTVIGKPVFTLSHDLSFPYHVIDGTKFITVHTFYSVTCNICKFNITYQIRQSFDFTLIGNPSCHHFYPLLVLECVRTQVVMTSLGDVKQLLPTR